MSVDYKGPLLVHNERNEATRLIVEPAGMEFDMPAGSTWEMHLWDRTEDPTQVAYGPDYITIYAYPFNVYDRRAGGSLFPIFEMCDKSDGLPTDVLARKDKQE